MTSLAIVVSFRIKHERPVKAMEPTLKARDSSREQCNSPTK